MIMAPKIVRALACLISFGLFAQNMQAQTIVGPNDTNYPEQKFAATSASTLFGNDWGVLNSEIFFGGADVLFGLSPANSLRRSTAQIVAETSSAASSIGTINSQSPNESLFSFATASSAQFATGGGTIYRQAGPNAPTAASDTFTWNNTGTDFNTAASWTNTGDLSNGVPNFNHIADFSVSPLLSTQPNLSATVAVKGLTFGVAAQDFVLSNSNSAQLAIGTGGIQASNATGTNSITAPLVLNASQSITQVSGGTLNITGAVVLGSDPAISLTIGNTSNNGTINFSPSSVELAGDLTLITNVNVTLPAITLLPAPPFVAGISKSGSGTLTLTAAGTYNGPTTINAGTLLITNGGGSATGTGAVLVNNSGTLAGNGFIDAGSNTITISGTLSPGPLAAAGNPGTINLASAAGAGALTLSSTSTLLFDITNTTTKDLIALTSTGVSLGGGTLALTLGGSFDYTQQYAIFTGVSGLTGSFGTVTGYDNANYAAVFTLNGSDYDLTFAPIPEPATWVGGVLALAAVLFAQRRRARR